MTRDWSPCRVCGKPNDPDDVDAHEICSRAIEQANRPHFTVPGHYAEVEAARIRAASKGNQIPKHKHSFVAEAHGDDVTWVCDVVKGCPAEWDADKPKLMALLAAIAEPEALDDLRAAANHRGEHAEEELRTAVHAYLESLS